MKELDRLFQGEFSFNKRLGQNFILDGNLLRAIVQDTGVDKNVSVLEIGTGAGTLTTAIADAAKKVVTVEVDTRLKPHLQEKFSGYDNIQLIFQDVMKADIDSLEKALEAGYLLIANLPYYITTPVIFKFLENATGLRAMYIMVQLEVANRICASPGTPEYGAITASIDSVATARIIRRVNRKMFVPVPNVDSAVVEIVFNKTKFNIQNLQLLKKVIKSAFAMRRKTLANNLKNDFSFNSQQIVALLEKTGINPAERGEKLTTQQFVDLANNIDNLNKIVEKCNV